MGIQCCLLRLECHMLVVVLVEKKKSSILASSLYSKQVTWRIYFTFIEGSYRQKCFDCEKAAPHSLGSVRESFGS